MMWPNERCSAPSAGIASLLQSVRLVAAVAELTSFGGPEAFLKLMEPHV